MTKSHRGQVRFKHNCRHHSISDFGRRSSFQVYPFSRGVLDFQLSKPVMRTPKNVEYPITMGSLLLRPYIRLRKVSVTIRLIKHVIAPAYLR